MATTKKGGSFKKDPMDIFLTEPQLIEKSEPVKETSTIPKGYRLVKEAKSERTQFLLRPTIKEAIKEAAAERGVSMNDLVNDILDEYIKKGG